MWAMDARDLIDDLAEVLVVPSFTRLGLVLRRRLYGYPDAETYSLAGRTVVLTGPTSGLGRAAAGSFARMGAGLVLVGRDAGRLERTRAELVAEVPSLAAIAVVADMASLASVRAAAAEILERVPRLDVLVDNAGTMLPTREVTAEGFERTFATMVLGPFVLAARLLPRLLASPDARLVAVTSGGMYTQALPLDDLAYERGVYNGALAYARAKRAQVALVREWAAAPAGHRRGRQRDAPGLGRHAGPRGVAARLRQAGGRGLADRRGGRGHDALAGRRAGGPRRDRAAVPRPPGAPVRPHSVDTADGRGQGEALGDGRRR